MFSGRVSRSEPGNRAGSTSRTSGVNEGCSDTFTVQAPPSGAEYVRTACVFVIPTAPTRNRVPPGTGGGGRLLLGLGIAGCAATVDEQAPHEHPCRRPTDRSCIAARDFAHDSIGAQQPGGRCFLTGEAAPR